MNPDLPVQRLRRRSKRQQQPDDAYFLAPWSGLHVLIETAWARSLSGLAATFATHAKCPATRKTRA